MTEFKLVPMEPTEAMIDAARDQHEGEPYLPVSLYKAMLAASPDVQGEPVAYAVFASNGNIRIWCADPVQVETLRQQYGEALQPLYAAPQPAEQQPAPDVSALMEALENAARSLRTISKKAGIDEFMSEMCEVRGYAESRAWCAEKDLAAFRQGGEP